MTTRFTVARDGGQRDNDTYHVPARCVCGSPVVRSWPVKSNGFELGRFWTCGRCHPEGVLEIVNSVVKA